MKKILLFIACLMSLLIGLASCSGNDPNSGNEPNNEITIYGNVIDRTTGHPLYNVLIQEKNKVGGSTVTGNDGNYELTLPLNGSSGGKYYLVASKDKYSSSEYELNMSDVDKNRRVKVDFQLTKESITYTGTVLDSKNQPIFDAHISAQFSNASGNGKEYDIGTTTMTDARGVYTLELPRPHYYNNLSENPYDQWKYAITATKSDYADLTYILNQNIDDMGKVITLNFIMESYDELDRQTKITISGKVTNTSGQPIAGAYVYDWVDYTDAYRKNMQISTTQTNSDGEYELIIKTNYGQPNPLYDYWYIYHTFECEALGYIPQAKTLHTNSSDAGKSYIFDFVLTKQ